MSKQERIVTTAQSNYYSNDGHGRLIRTEQDEVTTEKELEDRLSSCITYAEDFVRQTGVKRTLNFECDGCDQWLGKKMSKQERIETTAQSNYYRSTPTYSCIVIEPNK